MHVQFASYAIVRESGDDVAIGFSGERGARFALNGQTSFVSPVVARRSEIAVSLFHSQI